MTKTTGSEAFFEAIEERRSYYDLKAESPISDKALQALVERAVKFAPNSFFMQESRAVVVTGEHHQKLWDSVTETYSMILGGNEEQERFWKDKIDTQYRPGYGSVIFFEDDAVIEGYEKNMPMLGDAFKVWSHNAAGILQFIVWTALEKEGFGANLQHFGQYNPETDKAIHKLFDLPSTWRSTAILPFGVPAGPPGNPAHPKVFQPVEPRVKTFFA